MASFNYAPLAATAAKILAQYGRKVQLRNKTEPVYDPATSNAAQGSPTDVDRFAAVFSFGGGKTQERGNMVELNDKRMIMDAGTEPQFEDQIIDGSDIYTVISCDSIKPGVGAAIIYDLHVRHG
jgi:hypothetical protein